MLRNALAAAFAAWLIAAAAPAQPASPADGASGSTTVAPVVVQGRSPQAQKAFDEAVKGFLHDMGRPGPIGQISRWAEPVCPIVAGLTPAMDRFVDDRIREVATRVGAPGPADCGKGGNVMVIFTTQPGQLMTDIREHHEGMLGYHFVGETRSLAAFQPPMKSWYVTATRTPAAGTMMIDAAYAPGPPGGSGSRIPLEYRSEFAFATIVADANRLEGQQIGAVADRIAMLVLSRPAPREGCSALPSILDFLDPACPSGVSREGLTAYDEAYLQALYAYRGSELRSVQRRAMASTVASRTGAALPAPARP